MANGTMSIVQKVDSVKYLGLWLDHELSFKTHLDYITKWTYATLSPLYRAANCFTQEVRKQIILVSSSHYWLQWHHLSKILMTCILSYLMFSLIHCVDLFLTVLIELIIVFCLMNSLGCSHMKDAIITELCSFLNVFIFIALYILSVFWLQSLLFILYEALIALLLLFPALIRTMVIKLFSLRHLLTRKVYL